MPRAIAYEHTPLSTHQENDLAPPIDEDFHSIVPGRLPIITQMVCLWAYVGTLLQRVAEPPPSRLHRYDPMIPQLIVVVSRPAARSFFCGQQGFDYAHNRPHT